jgi:general stress protein YciG
MSREEAGRKGGQAAQHNMTDEDRSRRAKEAAETRKEEDPDAFKKMGEKGGHARSGNKEEDQEGE